MTSHPIRAAVAPLLVLGLAIALWWIGDRLVQIGPINRGTFIWIVVIPLWVLAPAAAGLGGRTLEDEVDSIPALVDGAVVGGVATAFLWLEAVNVDCAPTHTPIELIVPAALMGLLVGGGFALGARMAIGHASVGHHWRAIVGAALPQFAVLLVGPILYYYAFFWLCQRP